MLSKHDPVLLRRVDLKFLQGMEDMLHKTNKDARIAGKEPLIKLLLCKAMWEAQKVFPRCVLEVIGNLEVAIKRKA